MEKIDETILFLKIDKGKNGKYLADLQVKSEIDKKPVIKTMVQNQTITIQQKLFQDLQRFAAYRQRQPHTRKTGVSVNTAEQIQLEKQVGIDIYNTFFYGDTGKIFEDFFSLLTRSKIKRLVLVIGSNIPAVLNIPFELMRKDMESDPFILSNDSFLLTHTIEAGLSDFDIKGVEPLSPPLRLLFVSALPVDLPEDERFLELEKEQELLIEAVGDLESEKKVMVEFLDIAALDEIEKSLSRGEHHIVHFSGHGGHRELESGVLYLENEDGSTFTVTGEELAECLKKFSSIKLVVLNACETARAETYGVAGSLIKNGLPAVLGMRYPVEDSAAICFTSKLYEGICTGKSLCRSILNARAAVLEDERKQMEELAKSGDLEYFTSEWMTPFLYLNQAVDRLIDFSQKTADTAYFFQKPSFRPVEGGKYVGYGFIGRRKEIIRLTNIFKKEKRCICIYGQGGIGKTTLAIRFADNFDNGSYNIIQFRGEVTEEKILTGLANRAREKLGYKIVEMINSPDFSPKSKLNMLIEQYLSREKVIVFFDNFEDNQIESEEKKIYRREIHSDTLKEFLTHFCNNLKRSSYILFTTRYRFPEPVVEGFNLGEMPFPDSFKLINRFERLVFLKTGEKREIHQKLGGHPRALELLEGYFKKEKITWEGVAAGFKDVEDKEINHDLLLDMLWNRLNHTERRVLKAASVFRGMTFFKGLEKITGIKAGKIKNVLESLNAFSLVYLEEDTFYIHRLTSTFVTEAKMEKSERKKTYILAAEYFEGNRDDEGKVYIGDLLEARWHFLQAEEWDRAAELTYNMADYLNLHGYTKKAIELLQELEIVKLSDYNKCVIYGKLGNLYRYCSKYKKALKYYNISKEVAEKIGDTRSVALGLHGIGLVHENQSRYDKALNHYKRAQKIFEKIDAQRDLSNIFHQIGRIYQTKGDYDVALINYQKSLKIKKNVGDIKGWASSLHQIGIIYQEKGDYDEALKQFENVKRIFKKNDDIRGIAEVMHSIGIVYQCKGDYDEALKQCKNAKEIFEKINDIRGVAESLHAFGIVYQCKGGYSRALQNYQQALEILNKIGDKDNAAKSMAQMGQLYFEQNQFENSFKFFIQAFIVFTKVGSPNAYHTRQYIARVREKLPEEQFNAILKEFNLTPDVFDEGEKVS